MNKIQRITYLCYQLDEIKYTIIDVIYRLTELDFMREKGDEEGFDYLLETAWKGIKEYKYLIRKVYLELEATQPAQDFPGTHQEWLLFRKLFLSVIKDAEQKSEFFFNLLQALRDLYGIGNDDKNSR